METSLITSLDGLKSTSKDGMLPAEFAQPSDPQCERNSDPILPLSVELAINRFLILVNSTRMWIAHRIFGPTRAPLSELSQQLSF